MTVALIRKAAEARIADLVQVGELGLADGRRDGIHWKCRNPQRADKTAGSFVVDLGGKAPGRWKEFAGDEGGDVVDLVSYCLTGPGGYKTREARGQAIAWLERWTGLGDGKGAGKGLSPEERAKRQAEIDARRAEQEASEFLERDEKARRAENWWLKQGEPIEGTPIETYIEKARGVPLRSLPLTGAIRALGPSARNPRWAMFSAMARDSKIRAVHLTYLTPDGRKATDVDPVKKMWGDVRGSVIRVAKGALKMSPEQAAKKGRTATVALCEGIEDALTLSLLYPDWACWAAGSLTNLRAVAEAGWPACASEMILVGDNDPAGSKAEAGFDRAVEAWLAISGGKPVRTLKPGEFKDINDTWRAG